MKFKIGNRVVHLNMKFNVCSVNDYQIALDSGMAFQGSHYLLLDYDEVYPADFSGMIIRHGMKRGLIIESSPGKWHAISFTPIKYNRMIEIMRESKCDPKQLSVTIKRGFSGIRVTPKKDIKIRVDKEINNNNPGTNFYNYDAERVYLEEIESERMEV